MYNELANSFREGIWEVKGDSVAGYFEQGVWEVKTFNIEYFSERISFDSASNASVFEIFIKARDLAEPYFMGSFVQGTSRMRDVLMDFSSRNGLAYRADQKLNPQTNPYQAQPQNAYQQQPQYNQVPAANQYQQVKKTGKGLKIGMIILLAGILFIVGAIGYGIYWFKGITTIAANFAVPDNLNDPETGKLYDSLFVKAKPGARQALLNQKQSAYVTYRLLKETSFFNSAAGSPVQVDRMTMSPEKGKLTMKMVLNVKGGLRLPGNAGIMALQNVTADVNIVQYAITAELETKTLPQGVGMKPLSVKIGRSPLPINIVMSLVKQYIPNGNLTEDGYIIMRPTPIVDKSTGKTIGSITKMEVTGDNLNISLQ